MKVYEIAIKPVTGFGTPLKGDTIFGHFCWQIVYDEKLIGESLDNLFSSYNQKPFVVFSSACPRFCIGNSYIYAFRTPALPMDEIFVMPDDKNEKIRKSKEYKAKKWMMLHKGERFSSLKELEFLDDKKLLKKAMSIINSETRRQIRRVGIKVFDTVFSQSHNTINRLTGTTGVEGFAPFTVDQHVFFPETELALFVGIDESIITIKQIRKAIERIGDTGFGKDASTGLGRFQLGEDTEVNLSEMGCDCPNACYTLAPCVPEKDTFSEMFFTPFTRFGKHGDILAKSNNPFKNPIIMADEGAIFKPRNQEVFKKPYIGKVVSNISKSEPKTVSQGYSLYIPVKVGE